ncbi:hypothetical protein ACWEN6_09480 [Sphaerisporangium sp. NPDC004334]
MAAVLEWLARLVGFFGGAGPVIFSIVLLVATPFVDRLLVRRKRVIFRVLYNSKIGVGPETLHDGADPAAHGPPQLRQVARLLDRMSMVVIRIRNGGTYDIEPEDFERPLSFTFGGRVVWNARISEASTPERREELRNGLRFFPAEDSRPVRDNLLTVRQRLGERLEIYDGTWTDWKQVPGAGGRSLPIRIVGRGQNSGTRQLFERQVLGPGTGEGLLSSNSCLENDRNPRRAGDPLRARRQRRDHPEDQHDPRRDRLRRRGVDRRGALSGQRHRADPGRPGVRLRHRRQAGRGLPLLDHRVPVLPRPAGAGIAEGVLRRVRPLPRPRAGQAQRHGLPALHRLTGHPGTVRPALTRRPVLSSPDPLSSLTH